MGVRSTDECGCSRNEPLHHHRGSECSVASPTEAAAYSPVIRQKPLIISKNGEFRLMRSPCPFGMLLERLKTQSQLRTAIAAECPLCSGAQSWKRKSSRAGLAQRCFHSRHGEPAKECVDFVHGKREFPRGLQHCQTKEAAGNELENRFGRDRAVVASSHRILEIVAHEIHHDFCNNCWTSAPLRRTHHGSKHLSILCDVRKHLVTERE